MVGYDPNEINLTQTQQVIVSGFTSILSRCLIQPLDLIKIRFQVQFEPISKKSQISKYKSLNQSIFTIIKEEGPLALWKGHLTGQVLSMSYNLAQFFWFDLLTRTTAFYLPRFFETENKKTFTHFVCGGFAASLCVLTNQPIDTIRTRLISQGEPRLYLGIFDAFKKMYSKEGIKGFYRGTLPAIISNAPESAFRFSIYEILNSKWTKLNDQFGINSQNNNEASIIQSLICGSVSGIFSKAIVYPFDLSKKRLQIQGFEEARKSFGKVMKFDGLFNCLYLTVKQEGLVGIYKGFYPSMIKAAVSSGLTFFFYESFSNLFKKF